MKWFSKLNLKRFALLLVAPLILALSAPLVPMAAADSPLFSGGSGTASDPFALSTPSDLMALANFIADIDHRPSNEIYDFYCAAYYKLANDIDMSGYDWKPLGEDHSTTFKGNFNGNGKTISNVTSISETNAYPRGFFGAFGGRAYDFNLENIYFQGKSFKGTATGLGGVAGIVAANNALIDNVHVTGTLKAIGLINQNIGGIVGVINGSNLVISNCSFSGNIIVPADTSHVGGIFGAPEKNGTTVENCYTAGTISRPDSGNGYIGKIAGGDSLASLANVNFIKCTTSMAREAVSTSGNWLGYDGIEVSADINTYSVVRSIESSHTEAKFDIMGYFPANNISILQIGLSFDGFDIDDCNIEFVPNPSFGRFDVIGDITSGSVTLTFGLFHGNAIAHDDEEFLVTVIVTPKDGKTPNEAKLTIDSIVGIDGGAWVYDFTAEFTTATSLFRLPCDINNDGEVDLLDYYWVMFYFGCPAAEWGTYYPDVTGEGVVDMLDVTYVIEAIYSN